MGTNKLAVQAGQKNQVPDHPGRAVLFRIGPVCLCVLDGSGRFEFASPNALAVLGRKPEALLGTRVQEHLVPEDLASSSDAFTWHEGGLAEPRQLAVRILAASDEALTERMLDFQETLRDAARGSGAA